MPTMDKPFTQADAAELRTLIAGCAGNVGGSFGGRRYGEYEIRTGHSGFRIAMLLLERAREIATKFGGDQTGWLIELAVEKEPPVWFTLNYGGLSRDYGLCWTPNAERALRFSRREDAEAFMAANALTGAKQRFGQDAIKATEHAWSDTSAERFQKTDQGGDNG